MVPLPLGPELDLSLTRVRHAPLIHLAAAALAGGPLWWLVHTVTTTGLSDLWPVLGTMVAALLGTALLLTAEGPVDSTPVEWRSSGVDGERLEVPLATPIAEAWGRAAVTIWLGWAAAILAIGTQALFAGLLSASYAFGLAWFTFLLSIAGLWIGAILPLLLPNLPFRVERSVVVELEAHRLTAGGRSLPVGVSDVEVELEETERAARLVFRRHGVGLHAIVGAPAHLQSIATRIRQAPDRGDAREVPESLTQLSPS